MNPSLHTCNCLLRLNPVLIGREDGCNVIAFDFSASNRVNGIGEQEMNARSGFHVFVYHTSWPHLFIGLGLGLTFMLAQKQSRNHRKRI